MATFLSTVAFQALSYFEFQRFHNLLCLREQGDYELAPVREVPAVAGGRVKAFLFQRPAQPEDTFVVLWANQGELSLTLPVLPECLTVMHPFGTQVAFEKTPSGAAVAIGRRCYLRLAGIAAEQAVQILRGAK